jgi:hypothetical protein
MFSILFAKLLFFANPNLTDHMNTARHPVEVPEYYRWPGDLSPSLGLKFSDVPMGFAAFSDSDGN